MASGETPQAQYEGLAYGQNQQANTPIVDNSPPVDPTASFSPQDESTRFLYGPTDRPAEPITAGAPFGPGADYTPAAGESPKLLVQRAAAEITQGPNATPEVRAFAARALAGE